MSNPHVPDLVGLDWPPPPRTVCTIHAEAPARGGQTTNARFVVDVRMARLLLSPRAMTALDSIQTGVRRYLLPLGVDPAEITWWAEPATQET